MEAEAKEKAMIRILDYNLDLVDEKGRGSFGTIYKGIHVETSKAVAVKRVSKKAKAGAILESVRSLYLKKEIVHDHIVRVSEVKQWQDSMWIIMEFCHLGDLEDFFFPESSEHCQRDRVQSEAHVADCMWNRVSTHQPCGPQGHQTC